jgi:uncharacterized protein (TIGR02452 family)
MKASTRKIKAQETLDIIKKGFYETENKRINLKEILAKALSKTVLYRPNEFEGIINNSLQHADNQNFKTEFKVLRTTVLKAAKEMAANGESVGCLNFASAKNPGGGFLGGALAQEESLALSSTLYPTLMKHYEMYEFNRSRKTYLYSDYMIYSPDVVMFRDDDGELLEDPYQLTILTSPAVNVGAIKNNKPSEIDEVETTMLQRMDKVLAVFAYHGIKHLLLGAWGCGVFQNNPNDIARYFADFLLEGRYKNCFETVVFAIADRNEDGKNIEAFRKVFHK